MKLITFNVNGIRAAERRGFRPWLEASDPDVLALQEVRAPREAVPEGIFHGYHVAYDPGELAGRNGVALISKTAPLDVRLGLTNADEFAHEGRYIEADYSINGHDLTVASLYLPKGAVPSDSPEAKAKFERKMRFCEAFATHIAAKVAESLAAGRQFSVLGDYNIARTPQDLYNNHSRVPLDGYLPEEREWMTTLIDRGDVIDVVRTLHPDDQGPYSWWSWRGASWERGYGWRIDYHLSTPALAATAVFGDTDRPQSYESRVSDHAPVVVRYE